MSRSGGSEARVPTPPGHGSYYGARLPIHREVRTDLETRKRELSKEPDWGSYTPMGRQTEVGIYSTGVPRTRFKRVQEQTPKLDQVKVNYGLAPKKRGGTTLPELQELSPSESTESVMKLPALTTMTPEKEAMEARPFMPPPTPERKEKLPDENLAAQYRRLKYDLAALKQKAGAEIEMANAANAKLHRKVGNQKELLTRQSAEIRELTYQLDEMRRMQQQEVQQEAKKVSSSEKRAAALHRKLGDMSHEHEMAMSAAAASMRELQKERDAMAMALAAIATQALGGEEADAQSVSLEVDASVKEGNDPLPRTPQSWLHFRYIDVSEQATALRHRKLQGDGVRAVAALVAQVRRLWRKRLELGSNHAEAMHEVEKLTHIIRKVDVEYQAISDTVGLIERAAEQLRETRGMDLPVVHDASMPERLKTVQALLHRIATELDIKERELGKASVKLLEMDFYGKLHGTDEKPHHPVSDKEEESLPELSNFTEEEEARIVKMQAIGRGYIARKEVAAKKGSEMDSSAPASAADPDTLPDLSMFSEEERAKIVKMQAAGRGYIARKEVAAKRSNKATGEIAPTEQAEDLPDLQSFTAEEQARIVKIQAAGRGMASRKSGRNGASAVQQPAEAVEEADEALPDLSKFSAEERAKIIKMQAAGRGYIARKEVAAKQKAASSSKKMASASLSETEPATGLESEGLPDLSKFSEEERAKIIKMQAAGRGYIARKEVAARHQKAGASESTDVAKAEGRVDGLPDLSKFSEEERAKIVKMQAAGRGYIARKEVAARQEATRLKPSASADPSDAAAALDKDSEALPDLSKFSEEERAKIIKMQAAGRGYIARKEVAERQKAATNASTAVAPVEEGAEGLPDLSKFSDEERAKIVKMQAAGRGYIARKEVAERQKAAMNESTVAPVEEGAEGLPDLSKFSDEERAKIVKMQAAGRGYIARKEVAERQKAATNESTVAPVEEGAEGLPDLSKFSDEERAKIVKMQAAGRGYIARKEVAERQKAATNERTFAPVDDGSESLPDLSKFSEEERAKIVKMQAAGRGYIARKEVAARQNKVASSEIPANGTSLPEGEAPDDLPDLNKFSEEERAKVVKMQAAGRGYIARKEVAAKRASESSPSPAVAYDALEPTEDAEGALPDLSKFSEEERTKVVKMQAAGRGYIARKEVAAKKAEASATEGEDKDQTEAPAVTDSSEDGALPDWGSFSAADEERIVKIQSVGRGYLARREVDALKEEMNLDLAGGWADMNLPEDDPIPSLYEDPEEMAVEGADSRRAGQPETEAVPDCIEYDGDDMDSLPDELPHTPMTPSE